MTKSQSTALTLMLLGLILTIYLPKANETETPLTFVVGVVRSLVLLAGVMTAFLGDARPSGRT